MAALNPKVFVNRIMQAVAQSGGTSAYLSPLIRTHPRKFAINYLGNSFTVWVYIWTLTHGGRVRLPNEYRIQMTTVVSPLAMNPEGPTVLLGYYAELDMFAGFDLAKHRTFTTGSPSVQIGLEAIEAALQNGLSFTRKENDEIAIGVRPDQFITYCLNSTNLHRFGAEEDLPDLLTQAASLEEIEPIDIEGLAADRVEVINTVKRYSREANFRKKVINAYENRCAITRAQLNLVDAAHILPVAADNSSDHVSNGVSLSPTMHRAFDNCLIYLDGDLAIQLNEEKADELTQNDLGAGLADFNNHLNRRIHLPLDEAQRPNIGFIELANQYRRIPGWC